MTSKDVDIEAFLTKYPALSEAADKGSDALTATHFVMMQTDPNYRSEIENAKGGK